MKRGTLAVILLLVCCSYAASGAQHYFTGAPFGSSDSVNAFIANHAEWISADPTYYAAVNYMRSVNPNIKVVIYQSGTDVWDRFEEDQPADTAIVKACQRHGWDPEIAFMHFWDDTKMYLQGGADSMFIPGWQGGSATYEAQARIPTYKWFGGQAHPRTRSVLNFNTWQARQAIKEAFIEIAIDTTFAGGGGQPDGIMLDNSSWYGPFTGMDGLSLKGYENVGGHFFEDPNHYYQMWPPVGSLPDERSVWWWNYGFRDFLKAMHDTLSTAASWSADGKRKWLGINSSGNWCTDYYRDDLVDFNFMEFTPTVTRGPFGNYPTTSGMARLLNIMEKRVSAYSSRLIYSPVWSRTAIASGVDQDTLSESQSWMANFCWYLVSHEGESALCMDGLWSPATPGYVRHVWKGANQWTTDSLGTAVGDTYLLAYGTDSYGQHVNVEARNYATDGVHPDRIVLIRVPLAEWAFGLHTDDAYTVTLPASMQPIDADGIRGAAVSTYAIRNGTGAIFVSDTPFTAPTPAVDEPVTYQEPSTTMASKGTEITFRSFTEDSNNPYWSIYNQDFSHAYESYDLNAVITFNYPGWYIARQYDGTSHEAANLLYPPVIITGEGSPPTSNFYADLPTSGPPPLTVQFHDQSSNIPTAWRWIWGDGDSTCCTTPNPSHTYTSVGDYTVSLTASNTYGTGSTMTRTAYIHVTNPNVPPVASFDASPVYGPVPLTVNFYDHSTGTPPLTYLYNFGDTGMSALPNPTHTYTTANTWTVSLKVTNAYGSNTMTRTGYITSVPSGDTTPPSAITTLACSAPTTTSITLTWTAPGDDGNTGTAASYDIRYSSIYSTALGFGGATQIQGEPAPAAAGTAQSMVVSGLSPGTNYYFVMRTTDDANNISGISNIPNLPTDLEYPRNACYTVMAQLTGAQMTEAAKYNLLVDMAPMPGVMTTIRNLNPSIRVMFEAEPMWTQDLASYPQYIGAVVADTSWSIYRKTEYYVYRNEIAAGGHSWWLYTTSGGKIQGEAGTGYPAQYVLNCTAYCPTGVYGSSNGKRFLEWYAEEMYRMYGQGKSNFGVCGWNRFGNQPSANPDGTGKCALNGFVFEILQWCLSGLTGASTADPNYVQEGAGPHTAEGASHPCGDGFTADTLSILVHTELNTFVNSVGTLFPNDFVFQINDAYGAPSSIGEFNSQKLENWDCQFSNCEHTTWWDWFCGNWWESDYSGITPTWHGYIWAEQHMHGRAGTPAKLKGWDQSLIRHEVDATHPERARLALGTTMLGDGFLIYQAHEDEVHPAWDQGLQGIHYGAAMGSFAKSVIAGDTLYTRDFEHGTVVVNPNATTVGGIPAHDATFTQQENVTTIVDHPRLFLRNASSDAAYMDTLTARLKGPLHAYYAPCSAMVADDKAVNRKFSTRCAEYAIVGLVENSSAIKNFAIRALHYALVSDSTSVVGIGTEFGDIRSPLLAYDWLYTSMSQAQRDSVGSVIGRWLSRGLPANGISTLSQPPWLPVKGPLAEIIAVYGDTSASGSFYNSNSELFFNYQEAKATFTTGQTGNNQGYLTSMDEVASRGAITGGEGTPYSVIIANIEMLKSSTTKDWSQGAHSTFLRNIGSFWTHAIRSDNVVPRMVGKWIELRDAYAPIYLAWAGSTYGDAVAQGQAYRLLNGSIGTGAHAVDWTEKQAWELGLWYKPWLPKLSTPTSTGYYDQAAGLAIIRSNWAWSPLPYSDTDTTRVTEIGFFNGPDCSGTAAANHFWVTRGRDALLWSGSAFTGTEGDLHYWPYACQSYAWNTLSIGPRNYETTGTISHSTMLANGGCATQDVPIPNDGGQAWGSLLGSGTMRTCQSKMLANYPYSNGTYGYRGSIENYTNLSSYAYIRGNATDAYTYLCYATKASLVRRELVWAKPLTYGGSSSIVVHDVVTRVPISPPYKTKALFHVIERPTLTKGDPCALNRKKGKPYKDQYGGIYDAPTARQFIVRRDSSEVRMFILSPARYAGDVQVIGGTNTWQDNWKQDWMLSCGSAGDPSYEDYVAGRNYPPERSPNDRFTPGNESTDWTIEITAPDSPTNVDMVYAFVVGPIGQTVPTVTIEDTDSGTTETITITQGGDVLRYKFTKNGTFLSVTRL